MGAKQGKPTVLVVEDNELIQEAVVELLSDYAMVISSKSFNRARTLLKEHQDAIVAVFLDFEIQQFENEKRSRASGGDLVRYIKAHSPSALVFAASAGDEHRKKLVALGCEDADKQTAALKIVEYLKCTM